MKSPGDFIQYAHHPQLTDATLVLALSGWMDGGDVSTGTVERLVSLVAADPFAEIDPEPFYIYNFPGTMEIAALFRPHICIEEGLVESLEMPNSTFYYHEARNLVLFIGKEPNMKWRAFGECIFSLARDVGVKRILFVGSFGGAVPHTREPRLYVTCSSEQLVREMEVYGARRSEYEGPGSFTTYLMNEAPKQDLEMVSLVAEIPGYLQGSNPASIEAVTRRLAKILQLPLDLDSLRTASTTWELHVSSVVEEDEELAETVRQLEEQYDDELLEETEPPDSEVN
ncbi:MAG: PAC2 family protein [Pirellulaceae bacterium]|jgi:proteasome assembly chaperone (PAC2) family protein|nr:PAC2 family protein [Pirellulaceae bacterium]MDP7019322.1 PAC2 family protein [Pirellulaceae bacterium]